MSTYDGSRSARQSKRYSMSALYMSMTANEGEMQIEDDLAKGENAPATAADLASPFDNKTDVSNLQPRKPYGISNPKYPHNRRRILSSKRTSATLIRELRCLSKTAWRWKKYVYKVRCG
jgi:hypothetical protein